MRRGQQASRRVLSWEATVLSGGDRRLPRCHVLCCAGSRVVTYTADQHHSQTPGTDVNGWRPMIAHNFAPLQPDVQPDSSVILSSSLTALQTAPCSVSYYRYIIIKSSVGLHTLQTSSALCTFHPQPYNQTTVDYSSFLH